jgi:hypothetical protein
MLEWWTRASLALGDSLLGWLLDLPPDAAIFAVAAGSAAVLTLVRLLTTDQDLLRRAAADKKRLGVLIAAAKRRGEKEAVRRCRATRAMIGVKLLRAEGLPLLASLLPIALVATWCVHRLEFLTPQAGEPVAVMAYAPVSAAGELMHIVPAAGLKAESGWVRRLEAVSGEGPPYAAAAWTLSGEAGQSSYALTFRLKRDSFTRELIIGRRPYAAPVASHDHQVVTELKMRPLKLFNVVPGIPALYLPPWLVAYLLITIPCVPLLKRLLRIY